MLKELKNELISAQDKRDNLLMWIVDHTQHPDILKIVSDKNHLSVKIQALEFKINQLENGKPINGEPESDTTFNLENQHHLILKTINT